MKIVCDNCGAKYSIADEKVAGKVFKIRCKKCTNVIVVRGDQVAAAEEPVAGAAAGYDYGGEAIWHVVVDGDQQGPFAPAQIGQMLTDGSIDWEAYVWREGFDGWQPARDVPELVSAVTGEAPQGEVSPATSNAPGAASSMPPATSEPPTGASSMPPAGSGSEAPADLGADPFAPADPAAGASPFAGEGYGEAAVAGGDAGADLFAQNDPAASPFGGAVDDDVVASAPSPRVSGDQAMTGQRNENSVLFSLSNLQALATGSEGGSAPPASAAASSSPAASAGHATGEGSGLIDIRALASATSTTSGPSPSDGGGGAEDLLSIGGGGGIGSSLGAPVLAPAAAEPEKSNKGMVLLAVAGVAVVGLVVALVVVLTQSPEPVVAAANIPTAAPSTTATAAAAATTPGEDMAAAPANVVTPQEESDDEEMDEDDDDGSPSSRARRSRRRRASMRGSRDDRPTPSESSPMESPMEASTVMNSAMGSLDDLLDSALGGMSAMRRARRAPMMAASNLPEQPDRGSVRSALQGVSSRVASCGSGTAGVAQARIVFASSGRVRNVRVTGVPPNVQSCVSRGVRSARVPPFSRSSFNVNFPFRVR